MKGLTVFILVALVLVSGSSESQPPPDLDVLGVYFDPDATTPEIGIAPLTPFMAYFLLVNGSAGGVAGYEFSYHVDVAPGNEGLFLRLSTVYPIDIIILSLDDVDPLAGEYVLGWGTPLPMTPVVRLLTWQLMLLQPMAAQISTGPVAVPSEPWGVPIYTDGTTLYGMTGPYCSGRINEFCPIPTETRSFGAIKSLYR